MVKEIKFKKYYQAVKYLESLSNVSRLEYMKGKRRDFYLKRTLELINKLNIELNNFKYIHIAGTSGKGSTVAIVHEILNQTGKKVGSFYSPHPTTSIERIKVGEKYISANNFALLMEKIKPAVNKMYLSGKYGIPSYFEVFFVLALLYFSKKECEYVILETGCGGKFDATNIIKKPLITAITNIGYDHTQILGKSLEKIAATKAGIIKPKSIFITTEQKPKILKIFKNICQDKKTKFIALKGKNEKLAYIIAKQLKIKNINIKKTGLSCRFEIIQNNPTVILDGAHNYDKLKLTFQNLKKMKYNRLFLIFTLNENKQIKRIIKMLNNYLPDKSNIYITRHLVADRTCAELKMMYNLFPRNKQIFIDPWTALNKALGKAQPDDLILITGSFYLTGLLRTKWITEEKILTINS